MSNEQHNFYDRPIDQTTVAKLPLAPASLSDTDKEWINWLERLHRLEDKRTKL